MCDIVLELKNLGQSPEIKYTKAVLELTKALGYDSERQQKEVSPFRAVRDLENLSKEIVEEQLLKLYNEIVSKWLSLSKAKSDPFLLNNRIFINPKTGEPLTKGQWATIKKDILKVFAYIYAPEEERIAAHALAMGKILKGMSIDDSLSRGYLSIKDAIDDTMAKLESPLWRNTVSFAQQHAGELIVDLTQKQYKAIHDTIQNSIINRHSHRELRENLFDQFGNMNRDWRRIAETEIGNSQNNGQLITEIERARPGEQVFMKGVSSSEACPFCSRQVNDKIVALLSEPPDTGGDQVSIDGVDYTAIWPGKSNYGRKRADWWVAAGTQHPHAILPGQTITSALPSAVIEGTYEGSVIEITTEGGNAFSVTANHPILTPFGFASAKVLTKGMKILKSTNPEWLMESINPYVCQKNIKIEDLFALAKHMSSVPTIGVPTAIGSFHGDGGFMMPKVDIVNAYGLLGHKLEAALTKLNYDRLLDDARSRFGFMHGRKFLGRLFEKWFSHFRDIEIPNQLFPLLQGSHGQSDIMAFRDVSEDDMILFNTSLSKGLPTHSDVSREFIYRFSDDVSFDKSLIEFEDVSWRSPVLLVSDIISDVQYSFYHGKVYDLTDDIYGLYACNGIIVKNCRCTWVKHINIPGFEDIDEKFRRGMEEAMREGANRQKPIDDPEKLIRPTH